MITLLNITSCAVTGDPNQGGLFGWSEEQAQKRHADLEQQAQAARERSNEVIQNQRALDKQEHDLRGSVSSLQTSIDKLRAENKELRMSFSELMDEKKSIDGELAKLEAELKQTERDYSERSLVSVSEKHAEQINAQNDRMNTAILFLLKQR